MFYLSVNEDNEMFLSGLMNYSNFFVTLGQLSIIVNFIKDHDIFFKKSVLKEFQQIDDIYDMIFAVFSAGWSPIQSDPLNSYSLNSSFLLNSSGKFENFETITIDTNVKSTF